MKLIGSTVIMPEEPPVVTGASRVLKATADGGVVLLYRQAPIIEKTVRRFVKKLLKEIGRNEAHIDLIDLALRNAGIVPDATARGCPAVHQETQDELNAILADLLFDRMCKDVRLHRAAVPTPDGGALLALHATACERCRSGIEG